LINQYFTTIILLFLITTFFSTLIYADDSNNKKSDGDYWGRLQSHEANTLGYTFDDNDVPFLDFKISLKYPILHENKPQSSYLGFLPYPYFAFTGRFGQYIGTRSSSPVIGKRFNPQLFGRYWLDPDSKNESYIDLAYGHESNGQSITSQDEYINKRNSFRRSGEDANYADDYISRGWDYLGITWEKTVTLVPKKDILGTSHFEFRYFLENGLMQGEQEEYNSWENDSEGKSRKSVDGIRFNITFKNPSDRWILNSRQVNLSLTTGYSNMFRYITYRGEVVLEFGNIPVMLWVADGYNSDLANYYNHVTSVGVGFKLTSN
jgi:outer membrane phospholipase A